MDDLGSCPLVSCLVWGGRSMGPRLVHGKQWVQKGSSSSRPRAMLWTVQLEHHSPPRFRPLWRVRGGTAERAPGLLQISVHVAFPVHELHSLAGNP